MVDSTGSSTRRATNPKPGDRGVPEVGSGSRHGCAPIRGPIGSSQKWTDFMDWHKTI